MFLPLKMSPDLPNRSPSTYQELHLLLSLWSILCLRPSLFSHRALTWRRQGRLTTSVPVIVVAGWWREDLVHSSSQGALHIYPGKCGWTELEWAEHGGYGRSDGSHSDPMMMNSTKYRHAPAEGQKSTTLFHHHGHQICRTTFLFLHNMGESQFKTIKARYLSEGLVPRSAWTTHWPYSPELPCTWRRGSDHPFCHPVLWDKCHPFAGFMLLGTREMTSTSCHLPPPREQYGECALKEGWSILHVLQGLEAFSPTRHCTADDWPLLDLSAEQYCDRSQY